MGIGGNGNVESHSHSHKSLVQTDTWAVSWQAVAGPTPTQTGVTSVSVLTALRRAAVVSSWRTLVHVWITMYTSTTQCSINELKLTPCSPYETIVFLCHLLSATSKSFSSLSTRLSHAVRLGLFLQKTRYINSLLSVIWADTVAQW